MEGRQGRTLGVLFGGVLLGALDIAIVGPALPAIRETYALDASELSWIFNSYILLSLISAPLLGAWSDSVGRRSVYVFCLAVFGIGSALVAFSPGYGVLIGGRAVQAIGAGGLMPVASAVIADTFPENRRGRMLGLLGAVFGLAFILGPLLGVLLLRWSWRWLFVVNLPLLGILIPQALRLLPEGGARVVRRTDWRGALALAIALGAAAFLLSRIEPLLTGGGRSLAAAALLIAVTVGGAAVFVRVERVARNPLIAPQLMRASPMRAVAALAVATGFVEATMVFLPTLAVVAFAVSAQRASLMLLPLVAALIVGSVVAGRALDRVGARPVIQIGMLLVVSGLSVLGYFPPGTTSFYGGGLAVGLGLASLLGAPLRFVAQKVAGEAQRGASQGLLNVFLGTGRLAGAAMIGGIVPAGDVETSGFRQAMLLVAGLCALSLVATAWLGHVRGAASAGSRQ